MARKKKQPDDEQRADAPARSDERESGISGSGSERRDAVGRSGVYPESASERPSSDAPVRTENAWGQGERGAVGYQDSGTSEMASSEEIRRRIEMDRQRASQRSGEDQRSSADRNSGTEQRSSEQRSSDRGSSNDQRSR